MIQVNDDRKVVTEKSFWNLSDIRRIDNTLEDYSNILLTEDEKWEVLKKAAQHAELLGESITEELIERELIDYYEEKKEDTALTLVEECAKEKGVDFNFLPKTIHIEPWVHSKIGDNELGDMLDSFWDGFGDLLEDSDGNLYVGERTYKVDNHEGDYWVWCRVKDVTGL